MNYADELKAIRSETSALALGVRRLGWALGRTTPSAIDRTVTARLDTMKADSEPFRRLPRNEHSRVAAEIAAEETKGRQAAAGVARHAVEPLAARLKARFNAFVAARRADVSLSFPDALAGVDPNGMLTFHLLHEALRPVVEQAEPAALLAMYSQGLEAKDARARILCELVERRMDRGGLARTEQQIPIVSQLADYIDGIRDLRVPLEDLNGVAESIHDAERSVTLADVAHVRPIDPTREADGKQAFEADERAYAEAVASREAAGQ